MNESVWLLTEPAGMGCTQQQVHSYDAAQLDAALTAVESGQMANMITVLAGCGNEFTVADLRDSSCGMPCTLCVLATPTPASHELTPGESR